MLLSFFHIFIGLLFLYLGANWLVKSSTTFALNMGIPAFLIGLVIVGYGTSTPELIVSIQAALQNHPAIAAGNIIGSNILNSSLILGLGLWIAPAECGKKLRFFDAPFMLLCSIALFLGLYVKAFDYRFGIACLCTLFLFTFFSYRFYKKQSSYRQLAVPSTWSTKIAIFFFPISMFFLLYGSHLFLIGAIGIAKKFSISDAWIGLTLAAIGTSLPELATTIAAAVKKQSMLLVGGIIGSNIYNTLGILGVVSTIYPISFNAIDISNYLFMLLVNAVFCLTLLFSSHLGKYFGASLFTSYFIYFYIMNFL